MSFDQLPNEMWLQIFGHVDDIKDLSSISRCSSRANDTVAPHLYANFTQTGRGALPAFLRTILSKPHLAKYIKTITVQPVVLDEFIDSGPLQWPDGGRDGWYPKLSAALSWGSAFDSVYERGLWKHRPSNVSEYGGSYGDWDYLCSVLLAVSSRNLEGLTINEFHRGRLAVEDVARAHVRRQWEAEGRPGALPDFEYPKEKTMLSYTCIENVLRCITDSYRSTSAEHHLMPKLQYVRIVDMHSNDGSCLAQFTEFINLPSIRSFEADLDTITSLEDGLWLPAANEERVLICDTVSLTSMNVHQQILGGFLRRFDNIRKFAIEDFGDIDDQPITEITTFLSHLQHSLKSLSYYSSADDSIEFLASQGPTIGSLAGFNQLESLSVSVTALIGQQIPVYRNGVAQSGYSDKQANDLYQALPASLIELRLEDCRPGIFDCLHTYIACQKNLERMTLVFREEFSESWEEQKQLADQVADRDFKLTLELQGPGRKGMAEMSEDQAVGTGLTISPIEDDEQRPHSTSDNQSTNRRGSGQLIFPLDPEDFLLDRPAFEGTNSFEDLWGALLENSTEQED